MFRIAIKCPSCTWDLHSLWDNGGHPRNVSTPTPTVVPGPSCPRMDLGTTEDIPGMSQLPPPLDVVPDPRMYLGTTEDIPGMSQLPPRLQVVLGLSCPRMYLGKTHHPYSKLNTIVAMYEPYTLQPNICQQYQTGKIMKYTITTKST